LTLLYLSDVLERKTVKKLISTFSIPYPITLLSHWAEYLHISTLGKYILSLFKAIELGRQP
jgi:hypothetical protein